MPNFRDQETRKVPRRIFQAMLGATVLALGLATWTALWMAQRTTDLARENSLRLFFASLQSELDHLAATAGALGREHLNSDLLEPDHAASMTHTMRGAHLSDRRIDITLIFDDAGRLLNSYDAKADDNRFALGDAQGLTEIMDRLSTDGIHKHASFILVRGEIVLVAVVDTLVLAEREGRDPHSSTSDHGHGPDHVDHGGTIIAIGHYLTREELRRLGERLNLMDVTLLDPDGGTGTGTTELTLTDITGDPLARVVWRTPEPGRAALNDVLPIMAYLSLVLFGGTLIVARVSARQAQEVIEERQRARRDELTGLLNRSGMIELLKSPDIAGAPRRGEAAVIYLDLNGFKAINDQLGHEVGDTALKEVAKRIKSAARKDDLVVRAGGDEFTCLLWGKEVSDVARTVAARMAEACAPPITLAGQAYVLRPSIGVSIAVPGDNWRSLVRAADATMYQAKAAKRPEPMYSAGSDTSPPGRFKLPNYEVTA